MTHSFNDLRLWRDALLDRVFTLDGVRFLDLDEEHNRVAVGVDPERLVAAREVIDAWAEELTIPETALELFESGPVERLTSTTSHPEEAGFASAQQQTLQSFQRPVRAGFQTTFVRPPEKACTIGWVTLNGFTPAFVTASHCSHEEGIVDDSTYYQHRLPYAVGVEVEEATAYTCGGDPCHYGDVNVVELDAGITYDENVIGRTEGLPAGTINIDSNQPTFAVIGEYAQSTINQNVCKIGRTTGWDCGWIDGTSIDYPGDTEWISMDLDRAVLTSEEGDSGGPVFDVYDDSESTVLMAGIVSGRQYETFPCFCWKTLFTPMNIVHSEFPDLEPLFH